MQVHAGFVLGGKGQHGLQRLVAFGACPLVNHVFGQRRHPFSDGAFQHVAAVVLRAHDKPRLLVLDVVESTRPVDQLHKHALRGVLGVGRVAEERETQTVDRLRMTAEHRGYVVVVVEWVSLSSPNTTEDSIMSGKR